MSVMLGVSPRLPFPSESNRVEARPAFRSRERSRFLRSLRDERGCDPGATRTFLQAIRMIGPGIILAGTIVGSGELLLTTALGATTGFIFLWLILFSCVIKVFVQIEIGRYAISSGKPTLGALNAIGGPRFGANWLVWWWLFMMLATVFQLGAMTGTVGQSLNLAFPMAPKDVQASSTLEASGFSAWIERRPELPWAWLTCLVAIGLLWSGSYKRIEIITTAIVVSVTLLTVTATCLLPWTSYPIPWNEVLGGLSCRFPSSDLESVATAFGVLALPAWGRPSCSTIPIGVWRKVMRAMSALAMEAMIGIGEPADGFE